MGLSYRHAISVLQLAVYVPSLISAFFVVWRLGVSRSAGFIYLVLFALLRVAGAVCDLVTLNSPTVGLYIASAVCSSIALSPLIMLCAGLLSRV